MGLGLHRCKVSYLTSRFYKSDVFSTEAELAEGQEELDSVNRFLAVVDRYLEVEDEIWRRTHLGASCAMT